MSIKTRKIALAALASSLSTFTQAVDFPLGEGKLSVNGNMSIGQAIRTSTQDATLLPNANSSLVGISGNALTPYSGRNQDDGNLNFNRGDAVSQVAKAYLSLGYKWQDYGVVLSGKAWYDYALAKADHPYGNLPNGYARNQALSDEGADKRSRFSGIVGDNAYIYGRNALGTQSLDWKLGYQKLDWGNHFLASGGLSDLTPIDFPALTRPGVVPGDETRIAIPLAFARFGITPETSVEGFYQFSFTPNAPHECGTFYSQLDYVSQGCNGVMFGNRTDANAVTTGLYVHRAETQYPGNGEGGIALKQMVRPWNTELGLYATQFNSRAAFYSAIKSQQVGPNPYLPTNPQLNPEYFTEYPDDIRMFSATFDTKLKNGSVYGEVSYRPNQPVQYNAQDLLGAFVSSTAPTPLRDKVGALAPGASFEGYERLKQLQLAFGTTMNLPGILGAKVTQVGADFVYKLMPGLPDVTEMRFGRSDVYGQGPVNGVCQAPAAPTQCSSDGYVSDDAMGIRLQAGLRYPDAIKGVTLLPSLRYAQDLRGWSADGTILEGRNLANLSLRANFNNGWIAEIAWQPTWGGTYNNLNDRSTALADVMFKF